MDRPNKCITQLTTVITPTCWASCLLFFCGEEELLGGMRSGARFLPGFPGGELSEERPPPPG